VSELSKNKIKWIRSLRQKKHRDEEGLFILEGEKRFDELISFITQLTDEQKARLKTHLQVEVLQADTGSKTDKGKLKSLKSAFNSAFNNENIFQTSVIPKMMHNGYLTNPSALINEFKKNQFPTRQKIEPEGLD